LADPNLVFTAWQPYWQFQNWVWLLARTWPAIYAAVFIILIITLFWLSLQLQSWLNDFKKISTSKAIFCFFLLVSPLLLSYNALSHDVFNYLFNAKMVVVYQANPHVQTALNFDNDDWTRFMHNTHTVAPYGYGWTGLSLIPYVLGFGKFTWSWLVFRLFSVLSLVLVFLSLRQLAQQMAKHFSFANAAVFFLNPLVLIEVISNAHNDLWMLAPAIFSVSVLVARKHASLVARVVISLGLLGVSISIKYATIVLIPIWFIVLFLERVHSRLPIPQRFLNMLTQGIWEHVFRLVPNVAAVLLLLPLLTLQSQQYLPWYLTWSLVWLPLIKAPSWRRFWLVLSLAAMLRYVPWLYAGGYEGDTVYWQKIISLGVPAAYLVWNLLQSKSKMRKENILLGRTINE